jgi:hypothetical protein
MMLPITVRSDIIDVTDAKIVPELHEFLTGIILNP